MRSAIVAAALLVFATTGVAELMLQQDVALAPTAAEPPATLTSGTIGSATLSQSLTGATVALTGLPVVVDDVLQIDGNQSGWEAKLQWRSSTGFLGPLDTITIGLDDGILPLDQIIVANGSVVQQTGGLVNLPLATNVEITVVGLGLGTVQFDLVLTSTTSGASLVYAVELEVA